MQEVWSLFLLGPQAELVDSSHLYHNARQAMGTQPSSWGSWEGLALTWSLAPDGHVWDVSTQTNTWVLCCGIAEIQTHFPRGELIFSAFFLAEPRRTWAIISRPCHLDFIPCACYLAPAVPVPCLPPHPPGSGVHFSWSFIPWFCSP